MPRFRVHPTPKDDSCDRVVDFEVGTSKERRGLLERFKKAPPDPAPWEVDTEPLEAVPASRHDRNVPTTSRLRRVPGSVPVGAGRSAPDHQPVDMSGSVGRMCSVDPIRAVDASLHDPSDTDDPWAKSTGGKAYDIEAMLPPPPAPVPPDPIQAFIPDGSYEFETAGDSTDEALPRFGSDSFWELPPADVSNDSEDSAAPPNVPDAASAADEPPDREDPDREDPDSGYLGAGSDFDVDVGFTHDSVADTTLADWGGAAFDDLALAGSPSPSTELSFAPQPTPTPSLRSDAPPTAHDMSYPDIPTLTVDDAVARGRELMEAGHAEDALAILEMGLRMEPENSSLLTWLSYAERQVVAEILPDAQGDRILRLLSEAPTFADPRDARLVKSLINPRTFNDLRAEHSGMSMREFAGRVSAMLSLRVLRWEE
jgi:hypothetical protein